MNSEVNRTRYVPGQRQGHYESFFQRANHPTRPLAFWIRYTLFSPLGRPADAVGELWAIFFDGEAGRHVAVRSERPLAECRFQRDGFGVRIGEAELGPGALRGAAGNGPTIGWELAFQGGGPPLFLLPLKLYDGRFPKAKSLVGQPLAVYDGALTVDGRSVEVAGWMGSQNHNWGSQHTDRYAWGQVAGFDDAPESFLEVATAWLRLGPVALPPFTPLVLRHDGREYALNGLAQSLRARGRLDGNDWQFRSETPSVRIEGNLSAPPDVFVALTYRNPPGGQKQCLNSKIAACRLTLTDKQSGRQETLTSRHRAAFEILSDAEGG